MTEQVFVHPIVLGRHDTWTHSVKAFIDEEDDNDAMETFCDGILHHVRGESMCHACGVIQFRQPLSQPRVINAIRNLFPDGEILVELLTSAKQISRAIRRVKGSGKPLGQFPVSWSCFLVLVPSGHSGHRQPA